MKTHPYLVRENGIGLSSHATMQSALDAATNRVESLCLPLFAMSILDRRPNRAWPLTLLTRERIAYVGHPVDVPVTDTLAVQQISKWQAQS